MKSGIGSRSVKIANRKSSVSIEDDFWDCLRTIAKERHQALYQLVNTINDERKATNLNVNLSSAIRVFILGFYRMRSQNSVGLEDLRRDTRATLYH